MGSWFHTNCYYFWPDLEQGIAELKRVMEPGALMITGVMYEKLKEAADKGLMKYGPHWRPAKYMEKLEETHSVRLGTLRFATARCYYEVLP